MAFSGITATEAEIDQKSGANVSASFTDTMKTLSLLQAESFLNIETKFNWSDWYAGSPNADLKSLITSITASLVAIDAINYDIDAMGSTAGSVRLDVLRDIVIRGLKTLKEMDKKNWIEAND